MLRSPSKNLNRITTKVGQIAHVNLRNHDSVWAWIFLASFVAVIAYAMNDSSRSASMLPQPSSSEVLCLLTASVFFVLYTSLLKHYAYALVSVVLCGGPILIAAVLDVLAHKSEYFSPNIELGIIIGSVALAAFFSYFQMQNAHAIAATLELGTKVFFEFPSFLIIQPFLVFLWFLWFKFVIGLVFSGNILEVYQFCAIIWQDKWVTLQNASLYPKFLLCVQLIAVTGTFYALNTLVLSRAMAALYFGFKGKFASSLTSGISLYLDVLTGAFGTVVISGFVKALTFLLVPLNLILSWNPVIVTVTIIVGQIVSYFYGSVIHGFQSIPTSSYVTTVLLVAPVWVAPIVIKFVSKFIETADFFAIVVAGVTGENYATSCMEAGKLLQHKSASIADREVQSKKFTDAANYALPILMIVMAYLICNQAGIFEYQDFVFGCIAGVILILLSVDALRTALKSCLVCALMQNSADDKYLPGSPEFARKNDRSAFEIETLAMLNMKPSNSSPVVLSADRSDTRISDAPSTETSSPKLPARARSRSRGRARK
jgi:hypothetical protein